MFKLTFIVFFVWLMVMLTIQAVRQTSGKQMYSWLKTFGLGILGATFTSVVLFLWVSLF